MLKEGFYMRVLARLVSELFEAFLHQSPQPSALVRDP